MSQLEIHVWSDIACPWCYVGKRRFEAALALSDRTLEVNWIWRSFELNPAAPREETLTGSYAVRLAKKYGMSERDAEQRIEHLVELGRSLGLEFRFDRIRPSNTFDAHRILHLAKARGRQMAAQERLFRGYFSEGASLGDAETLTQLAVESGLKSEEVRAVLNSDAFSLNVRDDESEARELGIRGVPFFLLADKYAISGAQPIELMREAIARVERDLAEAARDAPNACHDSGCHVAMADYSQSQTR